MEKYKDLISKLDKDAKIECSYVHENEVIIKFHEETESVDGISYTFEFDSMDISETEHTYKNGCNFNLKDIDIDKTVYDMLNQWASIIGISGNIGTSSEMSIKIENSIINLIDSYPEILDTYNKVKLYETLLTINERDDNFEVCILLRDRLKILTQNKRELI